MSYLKKSQSAQSRTVCKLILLFTNYGHTFTHNFFGQVMIIYFKQCTIVYLSENYAMELLVTLIRFI